MVAATDCDRAFGPWSADGFLLGLSPGATGLSVAVRGDQPVPPVLALVVRIWHSHFEWPGPSPSNIGVHRITAHASGIRPPVGAERAIGRTFIKSAAADVLAKERELRVCQEQYIRDVFGMQSKTAANP